MKPVNIKQKTPAPTRNVMDGDELFFSHPEHGTLSGPVAAVGQHGVTIKHEKGDDGHVRVPWDQVLGHKMRRARKLTLVERGEDGAIAEDEDGKRVFVEGEVPEEEKPLNKSIPLDAVAAVGVPLPYAGGSLLQQSQIDCALIAAGYDPSIEYIRATYGEHWSKRTELMSKSLDLAPLIAEVAELKFELHSKLNNVAPD